MFKGKIYTYSNINGKENKFEKEFDNPAEYDDFISRNLGFNSFLNGRNFFDSFIDFNNYLENFFNHKMLESGKDKQKKLSISSFPELESVDLSKYEKELSKIELEKKNKMKKKNMLESTLEKLKGYLDKFKKEKKDNIVMQIEKDIDKVEKELSNF